MMVQLISTHKVLSEVSKLKVCQNCKRRKVSCDKRLPQCTRCIKRKENCEYSDKIDNKNKGIECYKLIGSNNNQNIMANKGQHNKFRIISQVKEYSKLTNPLLTSKIWLRFLLGSSWVRYLNVNIGLDALLSNKKNIELNLFPTHSIQKAILDAKDMYTFFKKVMKENLYESAVQAYFLKFNKFCPLFINRQQLYLRPRSKLFWFSILMVGLRYLNKIEYYEEYQDLLFRKLNPIRNDMNLDYLQALMVTFFGLRGLSITAKLSWIGNSLILHLFNSLGCYFNHSKWDYYFIMEKYCLFLLINYELSWKYLSLNSAMDYAQLPNGNVIKIENSNINLVICHQLLFTKIVNKLKNTLIINKKDVFQFIKYIKKEVILLTKANNTQDKDMTHFQLVEINLLILIIIKRYLLYQYQSIKQELYYKKQKNAYIQQIITKEQDILIIVNQSIQQMILGLKYFKEDSKYMDRLLSLTYLVLFLIKFHSLFSKDYLIEMLSLFDQFNNRHPFFLRVTFHRFVVSLAAKLVD